MSGSRLTILFLCTGNSCRSQMAEGWARALHGDKFDVYSAGIEAHGLNPLAVEVMREAGVDISNQCSKRLADLPNVAADLVVTVCSHADANCPVLPVLCRKLHVPFDDPPALAMQCQTDEEKLAHYRRVREEIREFVQKLPAIVAEE